MKRRTLVLASATAVLLAGGIAAWVAMTPSTPAGADPDDARQVARGRTVYAAHCAACHGARLQGQPNWRSRKPDGTLPAPPHDAGGHTWHHPDRLLFAITKKGGRALAPPGFISAMPGFGATLGDDEIWAVLAYIKSRWPPAVRERQALINARAERAGRN